MKVVIINGSNNSGKDNFANFFKKNYKYPSVNWSTIDTIKKVSKKYFKWDGKKTDDARKFLSDLKKSWSEFNDGPFNEMVEKIYKHNSKLEKKDKDKAVYFVHCREPHEISKFVEHYKDDCFTILLKRDNVDVANNDSDKNVNDFKYTFVIDNNGDKEKLKKEAKEFILKLNGK